MYADGVREIIQEEGKGNTFNYRQTTHFIYGDVASEEIIYIYHWRRKRGVGGGKGGMCPPTFLIGGAMVCLCPPPPPHF